MLDRLWVIALGKNHIRTEQRRPPTEDFAGDFSRLSVQPARTFQQHGVQAARRTSLEEVRSAQLGGGRLGSVSLTCSMSSRCQRRIVSAWAIVAILFSWFRPSAYQWLQHPYFYVGWVFG